MDPRTLSAHGVGRISYHVTPEPFPGAPVVILANGLGGTYPAWRGVVDYLGDRYRFITWDYRGLYGSSKPDVDKASSYAIDKHVGDLQAILDHERVERASLVGWSMGVQVVLEAYLRLDVATNLVLMNGTYGRPLRTLTPVPGLGEVLPSIVDIARGAHALATRIAHKTSTHPHTMAWFRRMGLIGPTLDPEIFAELVQHFGGLDMEGFLRNLRAIGVHDAGDVLETINVPTLLITGDHDRFTPTALAQQMARRISGSELLVVPGGTHYTCVEFPELVSLRIERFYEENGFGA